jgi:hypothetical protein
MAAKRAYKDKDTFDTPLLSNFTAPQMVNKMHSTKMTLTKSQARIGEGHQVKGG